MHAGTYFAVVMLYTSKRVKEAANRALALPIVSSRVTFCRLATAKRRGRPRARDVDRETAVHLLRLRTNRRNKTTTRSLARDTLQVSELLPVICGAFP